MKNSKLLEGKIIEILYRWVHREEGLNPMPTDEIMAVFKQHIKAKMPEDIPKDLELDQAIQEATEALMEGLE